MTTETILTDEQINRKKYEAFVVWRSEDDEAIENFARGIEQAALQSPQVQSLINEDKRLEFMMGEGCIMDVCTQPGRPSKYRLKWVSGIEPE